MYDYDTSSAKSLENKFCIFALDLGVIIPTEPPIDFNGIDSTVHGPLRLGVLCALKKDGELDFTTLKKRLSAADGALGIHLQKLETIGYITCHKEFVGRRPRSTYKIAPKGSKALSLYIASMQRIIDSLG